MWRCTDKDNFHRLISDVVARRCTNDATDTAKHTNDMIDAGLALNLPEDTLISDLMTFFIGGFHTSAAREAEIVVLPWSKTILLAVCDLHGTRSLCRHSTVTIYCNTVTLYCC